LLTIYLIYSGLAVLEIWLVLKLESEGALSIVWSF